MTATPVSFYRNLDDAQRARIASHEPTLAVDQSGNLTAVVKTILTPKGLNKDVTYMAVKPTDTERIAQLQEVPQLFEDLQHVNLILTNACNLKCTYCYEQHNRDFGRFTPESLKQIYDFQLKANERDGKMFQFFGGEPMVHRDLILDFLAAYREELDGNSNKIKVGMITNGLLLSPEFVQQYFSNDFVTMSISLDTLDATKDHRELKQDDINHIVEMIGLIPKNHKDNHLVSVRCTISRETAPQLVNLVETLYYKTGLRSMVIHPLTMSSVDGFIVWPDDEWNKLHEDILYLINTLPGFNIQFSEGVGVRGGSNCLVGSDMIAVDGSGDFSGCYFITNHKEGIGHAVLGNILNNQVFVDRYLQFQQIYSDMFTEEEQCKTCDLKGFCYQCPAGNLDANGKLFRPDAMCQKIVTLFIDLQNDIAQKAFFQKLQTLAEDVAANGEQRTFARSLTHLMYKTITGFHISTEAVGEIVDSLPPYQRIAAYFVNALKTGATTLPAVNEFFKDVLDEEIDIKTLYEELLTMNRRTSVASSNVKDIEDPATRVFYLTLIHMILLNRKGDDLSKPTKIITV